MLRVVSCSDHELPHDRAPVRVAITSIRTLSHVRIEGTKVAEMVKDMCFKYHGSRQLNVNMLLSFRKYCFKHFEIHS